MQVHAVPDNEKALDASGRRLPWAFEYADSDVRRREQEEKGPFGRSTRRRGFSRSKTTTPARKEDVQRLENMQAEDAIFNTYKASQRAKDNLVASKSAPLLSLDSNGIAGVAAAMEKEATEVILYGYGRDMEWAAIEFYERVSGGSVLEDYDRHPPNQRYDLSISISRAAAQRSLSKAALRKRNTYNGGAHWIKITFDSPEAADLACNRSPHTLHGYMVFAEPYRGAGPPNDAPVPATNAGAQIDSQSLPTSFSTATLSQDRTAGSPESSNTISTATISGHDAPIPMRELRPSNAQQPSDFGRASPMPAVPGAMQPSFSTAVAPQEPQPVKQRPMRIEGARRAVLRPADQALMPTQPRYTSWLAFIPLFGWLIFGGVGKDDQSSSQIPRLADGSPDWNKASVYWQFFAFLDNLLGTDMCGLKGDD
ncbi:hypothetical protein K461DRAFT_231504 [Myriangium duriaei CBS 260.36]|uniref:Nucleoporin NUP53 n=1 Tax=Myriangium duriaei CBS 260.36 TaxID=1168546 RepID=A0A9P4IXP2_9PEZI|nr:hypothetical protein K461DRAFT_231504 [Myriangium duriaei CBS 260.36]